MNKICVFFVCYWALTVKEVFLFSSYKIFLQVIIELVHGKLLGFKNFWGKNFDFGPELSRWQNFNFAYLRQSLCFMTVFIIVMLISLKMFIHEGKDKFLLAKIILCLP